MSIKDAYRLGALIIVRLLKKGCISLTTRKKSSCTAHKHDSNRCKALQLEKILFQNKYIENTKLTNKKSPKPNSLKKQMGHNCP
jgi:hypothetical protein